MSNPLSRTVARAAAMPSRNSPAVTVHLRRMYVDCRFGQLHVHTSFPSSGGFDELTPLLCLPPPPLGGRVFQSFLAEMGQNRSVYAPEPPGCGESDAPETAPLMQEYAQAYGDLIDSLRLRQIDVLGYQAGALAAAELAIGRPSQVRRVVMVGVPLFDARERDAYTARPWPAKARDDGSHLIDEWQRIRHSGGPGTPLSRTTSDLASALRAGDAAAWGPAAAAHYAAGERFPLVRQPVLLLRPRDDFWEMTVRSEPLLHGSRRVDLPECDGSLFDVNAAAVARHVREFLDH